MRFVDPQFANPKLQVDKSRLRQGYLPPLGLYPPSQDLQWLMPLHFYRPRFPLFKLNLHDRHADLLHCKRKFLKCIQANWKLIPCKSVTPTL
jgi:hypothetical protein